MHRGVRDAVLARGWLERRRGQRRGAGGDDLRQLAAGGLARGDAGVHRRPQGRRARPQARVRAPPHRARLLRAHVGRGGPRGERLLRAGVGGRGVERRRPRLSPGPRRPGRLRRGAAPPLGPRALGGSETATTWCGYMDGAVRSGTARRARCWMRKDGGCERDGCEGRPGLRGRGAPGREAARPRGLLPRADRDVPGADRAHRSAAERLQGGLARRCARRGRRGRQAHRGGEEAPCWACRSRSRTPSTSRAT